MYCVKCGVELADSEIKCPLCNTKVFHPDISREIKMQEYPLVDMESEKVNKKGALLLLTIFGALTAFLCFLIDFKVNGVIRWSGYVCGGLIASYFIFLFPGWFSKKNPVIFLSVDNSIITLFLLYIDIVNNGGWFLTFAFPIMGVIELITGTVLTLVIYVRRGYLFIFGGAIIAIGGSMVLLEYLIYITFGLNDSIIWSFYPLAACFVVGMFFIITAICRPLRDMFKKNFFI